MLISFSISNYRSFDTEQTFSFVASKRTSDHPEHCRQIPSTDLALLPASVFYGANGAGKSNFVRALSYFRTLVLEGTKPNEAIGVSPFLLRPRGTIQPTTFELRILLDERIISYSFSLTSGRILEERLELLAGEKAKSYFERESVGSSITNISFGAALRAEGELKSRLQALAKAGPRSNQLFLTAIRENIEVSAYDPILQGLLNWISDRLQIVMPESRHSELVAWLADNNKYADFVNDYVHEAGTGINRVSVETQPASDPFLERMGKEFGRDSVPFFAMPDGDYTYDSESQRLRSRRIVTEHNSISGDSVPFPLREESDGTQRLFHLLPALFHATDRDVLYVIDEIDRSLHPLLAKKFVENFISCAKHRSSQLIVTTHDTNLLDLNLFRRDEIWFAEKDAAGATHIYPLSDFKVRKDLRVAKGYLDGRFGGIPFLGGIDKLFEHPHLPGR